MIAFAPPVPFITDLVTGNAETGWQPIRCLCLGTSATVTHQQPIRCLQSGKTLLTRVETSSARCWPLHQQLVFLITLVKGPHRPGSPTLPHEKNDFALLCFCARGLRFLMQFVLQSLCLRGSSELCLRNPNGSLRGRFAACLFLQGVRSYGTVFKAGTHCAI